MPRDLFADTNQSGPRDLLADQAPEEYRSLFDKATDAAAGFGEGLGNRAIGFVQAATDLGESGARAVEKAIYGDNMLQPNSQSNFGGRLAQRVKELKAEQAQLPISERVGIFAGEIAPNIATGVKTGAQVAAKTGSKLLGLMAGNVIGGAAQSGLSPQEEAGLGNRAIETAKGAAWGAATPVAFGAAGEIGKIAAKPVKFVAEKLKPAAQQAAIKVRKALATEGKDATQAIREMEDNGLDLVDVVDPRFRAYNQAVSGLNNKDTIKIADQSLERLDKVAEKLQDEVTNMVSKNKIDPEEAGQILGRNARKIVDAKLEARRATAKELYSKSFEENPTIPQDNPIFKIPVVREAIQAARDDAKRFGSDAIVGDVSNLPDNSLKVLHLAQQYLYKKSKDLTDLNTAEFNNVRAKVLDVLKQNTNYKAATTKYAGDTEELQKVLNGTSIGKIAKQYSEGKIDDLTKSAHNIFKLPPIRIAQLRKQDPEKFNDLLRHSIENELASDAVDNIGGFHRAIFGKRNGIELKAALGREGDDVYKGLEKLTTVLDRKAQRTKITRHALEENAKAIRIPFVKFRMVNTAIATLDRGIDHLVHNPKVQKEFANYMFTEEGKNLLRQIAATPQKQVQEQLVSEFLIRAIALSVASPNASDAKSSYNTRSNSQQSTSGPSKRGSYSIISDANAQEPTNEELMKMAEEQRKRYPGVYANITPEQQARMLTRGRGENSKLMSDELTAAQLLDLQEQERRKYPGLYAHVPKPKKQNYGGN